MMIDVKEGEMSELLLGNKEEGVKHVKELGHVEKPGKVQRPQRFWIIRVVDRLTSPAVVSADVESGNMFC